VTYNFANTEKRPFWLYTVTGDNIFFQQETNFFCFTTLIQLSMHIALIKIEFLKKKFDRVPQLPAFNGSGFLINSLRSTFHRLHLLGLWTPTILFD
jgi:hypothetical protein